MHLIGVERGRDSINMSSIRRHVRHSWKPSVVAFNKRRCRPVRFLHFNDIIPFFLLYVVPTQLSLRAIPDGVSQTLGEGQRLTELSLSWRLLMKMTLNEKGDDRVP